MTQRAGAVARAKAESAEVRYATDTVVLVGADDVAELKHDAALNPRRRIRLCAHAGVADTLHEMLIVHARECYVRPHKHLGKSESFHVVEGDVDVVLFDEDGAVTDVMAMGAYGSGRPFFYRIATPMFHTLFVRSDVLVFHQATRGTVRRADTVLV